MVRVVVKDPAEKESKQDEQSRSEVDRPSSDRNETEENRVRNGEENETAGEASNEEMLENLKQAEESAKKNFDLYVRCQADMENMKKRFQRDKEDWIKFANESLIKDLLPVMDNLEKAIAHSGGDSSPDSLREGVELTLKGMRSTLEKAGLKEINSLGEPFDPNFHEAMTTQEDDRMESGRVLQEFQRGYLLNDRLLRPSLVVVSRRPEGEEA